MSFTNHVNYPILSAIVSVLIKLILGDYDGIMLSCACTMASAGLLRSSEFLVLNNHCLNDSECLLIDDIIVIQMCCVKFEVFQTDIYILTWCSNTCLFF